MVSFLAGVLTVAVLGGITAWLARWHGKRLARAQLAPPASPEIACPVVPARKPKSCDAPLRSRSAHLETLPTLGRNKFTLIVDDRQDGGGEPARGSTDIKTRSRY
jgi:hypothetical protein